MRPNAASLIALALALTFAVGTTIVLFIVGEKNRRPAAAGVPAAIALACNAALSSDGKVAVMVTFPEGGE